MGNNMLKLDIDPLIFYRRKITLLRIMKVIKQYQPQLGSFPSYFYKNILFKMDKENPNASWDRVSLPAR